MWTYCIFCLGRQEIDELCLMRVTCSNRWVLCKAWLLCHWELRFCIYLFIKIQGPGLKNIYATNKILFNITKIGLFNLSNSSQYSWVAKISLCVRVVPLRFLQGNRKGRSQRKTKSHRRLTAVQTNCGNRKRRGGRESYSILSDFVGSARVTSFTGFTIRVSVSGFSVNWLMGLPMPPDVQRVVKALRAYFHLLCAR